VACSRSCCQGASDPDEPSIVPIGMSMSIRRKKHSKAEIAAKLVQADDLAKEGMLRSEIARRLGVSVMTLHRWRKMRLGDPTAAAQDEVAHFEEELGSDPRIAELELENSRLRRLVTDLLLDKVKLEEAARGHPPPRRGRNPTRR
jgi:putative transposase